MSGRGNHSNSKQEIQIIDVYVLNIFALILIISSARSLNCQHRCGRNELCFCWRINSSV